MIIIMIQFYWDKINSVDGNLIKGLEIIESLQHKIGHVEQYGVDQQEWKRLFGEPVYCF